MGKLKIKDKLSKGESITGKVENVSDTKVTFEMKDESLLKVSLPEEICEILDEDYDGNIVTVTNSGGEFEIEDHEEWPEEKSKKD